MKSLVVWAQRDADVVWHGFTQMAAYLDNAPIIVEALFRVGLLRFKRLD